MPDPTPTPAPTLSDLVPLALAAATTKDPGTVRRAVALAAGLALPLASNFVTSKLGIPPVSDAILATLEGLVAVFVTQSVVNDIHARSDATARANASTPAAAVADLNTKGV